MINRRELFKLGMLAGGAGVAAHAFSDGGSGGSGGNSSGANLVSSSGLMSPPVTPWLEPLFIPAVLQPSILSPAFSPDEPARDWWPAYTHQRCKELAAPKTYKIDVKNTNWSFHRQLPTAPMFAYNGTVPGSMIHAKYGEPWVLRINNQLAKMPYTFGMPECAVHLHNMHTPAESDGYPGDFVTPGNYRDHHYPMLRAGYDTSPSTNGDYRESLGTLWFHDHRLDFTSHNVYRGMYGFCSVFDEIDTGNEMDPSPKALRLPSGKYDITLGFTDPQFDNQGNIFFNVFDMDGHLGDKVAVNGKIQPVLEVERRKYRFRLLDCGPSRFYHFYLSKGIPARLNKTWLPMTLIANDGNLFEKAIQTDNVIMSVANRMDVIVDFSNYNDGDEIFLVNRMEQTSGRGPTFNLMDPGVPVLKFKVRGTSRAYDPSVDPLKLAMMRPLPRPSAAELSKAMQRTWRFDRTNGGWSVNGAFVNLNNPSAVIKQGTSEIWNIENNSGSWSHPVHIHFEEFQILSRNGVAPPNYEVSRKDVMLLHPNEKIQIFIRFRDMLGHYVMHCHNVVHEDHSMMVRWDIVK